MSETGSTACLLIQIQFPVVPVGQTCSELEISKSTCGIRDAGGSVGAAGESLCPGRECRGHGIAQTSFYDSLL